MQLITEVRYDTAQAEVALKQLGQQAQQAAAPVQQTGLATGNLAKSAGTLNNELRGLNPAINATRGIMNNLGGDTGKVAAQLLGVGKEVTELRGKMVGGGGLVASMGAVGLAVAAVTIAFEAVSKAVKDAEDHAASFSKHIEGPQYKALQKWIDKAKEVQAEQRALADGFKSLTDFQFKDEIEKLKSQIAGAKLQLDQPVRRGAFLFGDGRDDIRKNLAEDQGKLDGLLAAQKQFNKDRLDEQRKFNQELKKLQGGNDVNAMVEGLEKEKAALQLAFDLELAALEERKKAKEIDEKQFADYKLALERDLQIKITEVEKQAADKRQGDELDRYNNIQHLRISLIDDKVEREKAAIEQETQEAIQAELLKVAAGKESQQGYQQFLYLLIQNREKRITDITKAATDERNAYAKQQADQSYEYFRRLAEDHQSFLLEKASRDRALAGQKFILDSRINFAKEAPFHTRLEQQQASIGLDMVELKVDYETKKADLEDAIKKANDDIEREIIASGPMSAETQKLKDQKTLAEQQLAGLEVIFGREDALLQLRRKTLELNNRPAVLQAREAFAARDSVQGLNGNGLEKSIALNREINDLQERSVELAIDKSATTNALREAEKAHDQERIENLKVYLALLEEEETLNDNKLAGVKSVAGKPLGPAGTEQLAATLDTIKQVSSTVEQSLGDAVMAGLTGHNDQIKDIFRNLFMNIADDFTRLALNNIATALLGNSASPTQNGIGGLVQLGLTSAVSAVAGTPAAPSAPGADAAVAKSAPMNVTNVVMVDDEATAFTKAVMKKPNETVNVIDATRNKRRATSRVA